MKNYKFLNTKVLVLICFCCLSNITNAQYNENGDDFEDIDVVDPDLNVVISGQNAIDPIFNRTATYYIMNHNNPVTMDTGSWFVEGGRILSFTNQNLVVEWNKTETLNRITGVIHYDGVTLFGTPIEKYYNVNIHNSDITGEENIDIASNSIQTYTIENTAGDFDYIISNNSWIHENCNVISYGSDSITVQWLGNELGNFSIDALVVIESDNGSLSEDALYSKTINIVDTSQSPTISKSAVFTYDSAHNQTRMKIE